MLYITVDTSVVRAAGPDTDAWRVLDTIENHVVSGRPAYGIALSDELRDEWLKPRSQTPPSSNRWNYYLSRLAYEWMLRLQNRRRVRHVGSVRPCQAQVGPAITQGFSDPNVRKAVAKDLHLVLTAFKADWRIVSAERRLRRHLQRAAENWAPGLRCLLWPADLSSAVQWLQFGAPNDPQHRL